MIFQNFVKKKLRKHFYWLTQKKESEYGKVDTGNGNLTFLLAEAVGKTGQVVTTDVNPENVEFVENRNKDKKLNIKSVLLPLKEKFLKEETYQNYFDQVITLASFHHFDNKAENTGETGRKEALNTFYKNLKKGGRLVIADVFYGTISQKYFDVIDSPIHIHPAGHPRDFPTKVSLYKMAKEAGFKDVKLEVSYVAW